MTGLLLAVVIGLMAPQGSQPTAADCACATARQTNGWCEAHRVGYVASVKITSGRLYEVLDAHGHELDLTTFQCDACRKAIASDGFCDQHRIGFVGRLAYFSRLTYELARGEPVDPAGIECPACRVNAGSHGWCDKCSRGMVGDVAIRDKAAYQHAAKAVEILISAAQTAARCEWCAVAMITDTQCPDCKITYKDGVPVPAPANR